MLLRGVVEVIALLAASTAVAFRLAGLLSEVLIALHIPHGGQQDWLSSITQGKLGHLRPRREATRKRFPFCEDGFNIPQNEVGQSHRFLR